MKLRERQGRPTPALLFAALAVGLWAAQPAAAQTPTVEPQQPAPSAEPSLTEPSAVPGQPVDQAPAPVATETADAKAEGGGMPQLDPSSFPPQLVWLAITFIALYLLMSRVALPRIGAVLDERRERITEDLEKASQLRQEAESVLAEYEQGLATARAEAQAIGRTVADEISTITAAAQEELGRELAEQTREAEVRIAAAKQAALENVRAISVEVAQAATARLIGEEFSATEIEPAVESAIGRRS